MLAFLFQASCSNLFRYVDAIAVIVAVFFIAWKDLPDHFPGDYPWHIFLERMGQILMADGKPRCSTDYIRFCYIVSKGKTRKNRDLIEPATSTE
jgi:hypothetical protein